MPPAALEIQGTEYRMTTLDDIIRATDIAREHLRSLDEVKMDEDTQHKKRRVELSLASDELTLEKAKFELERARNNAQIQIDKERLQLDRERFELERAQLQTKRKTA